MAVVLNRYGSRGVRVSTQWLAVLRAADHNGIPFVVNSGARTRTEQEALIRLKGCWSRTNTDGAACPWNASNHVVKTSPAHAIDVDDFRNGENRLQAWLNSHRLVTVQSGKAVNPVPGEAWHLEIGRLSLWRLYRKYRRFV
jgi:hypothetical protein